MTLLLALLSFFSSHSQAIYFCMPFKKGLAMPYINLCCTHIEYNWDMLSPAFRTDLTWLMEFLSYFFCGTYWIFITFCRIYFFGIGGWNYANELFCVFLVYGIYRYMKRRLTFCSWMTNTRDFLITEMPTVNLTFISFGTS